MRKLNEEMIKINENINIKIVEKIREFSVCAFRFCFDVEIYTKNVITKIGYIHIVWNNLGEKEAVAHLIDFYVDKIYRCNGIGTQVLQKILDLLKTEKKVIFIFGKIDGVNDDKDIAKEFYKKNGFVIVNNNIIKFL